MSEGTTEKSGVVEDKCETTGSAYHRPKTRGEMRNKLKEGVPCEIVISNALVSLSLLRSLDRLKDDGFVIDSCSVRESENKGYAVFEPNGKMSFTGEKHED